MRNSAVQFAKLISRRNERNGSGRRFQSSVLGIARELELTLGQCRRRGRIAKPPCRRCGRWVKGGHAEQVAAATGSPQKAALVAAGRDFGLGPLPDVGSPRSPDVLISASDE